MKVEVSKVVIKFEMPEHCGNCPFWADRASCVFVWEDYEFVGEHMHNRPNWCPLVTQKEWTYNNGLANLERLNTLDQLSENEEE